MTYIGISFFGEQQGDFELVLSSLAAYAKTSTGLSSTTEEHGVVQQG